MKQVHRTTLLALVATVQDHAGSDAEVVAVIEYMIKTGRVTLSGTFAGEPFEGEPAP